MKLNLKKYMKPKVILHWAILAAAVVFVLQALGFVQQVCPFDLDTGMFLPCAVAPSNFFVSVLLPTFVVIAVVDVVLEEFLKI